MEATKEITRPALRYYGGKYNLAEWIISHFPTHKTYCEPCGGAGSVIIKKPRAHLETFNDLSGDLVNFFRVLRDYPENLIRLINLTPWAREEYRNHHESDPDPIERARRFWIGCNMSIACMPFTTSGFRVCTAGNALPNGAGETWLFLDVSHLEKIAQRFRGVQIENRDFFDVVLYNDGPENLIYFDPPYLKETRTNGNQYNYEVDEQFHIDAARVLGEVQGHVVVSGYAHPLYTEIYEAQGWTRRDRNAQGNSGAKRIESIWLSPRTWAALQAERNEPKQLSLSEVL